MKVAVFGKNYNKLFFGHIHQFLSCLVEKNIEVFFYKPFYNFIEDIDGFSFKDLQFFSSPQDTPRDIDFMMSIGGDGTFLESLIYLDRFDIPVIGLNSGRLGFLANISKEEISEALESIFSGNFKLDKRALINIEAENNPFGKSNFALNDATIQKTGTTLITIDVFLNNEYLNTYWTDGLIISTPTGSTAYSLSVGGPIVLPRSKNLVLAPIASHNLTVRPIVIPDEMEIRLEVRSRSGNFYISMDNRTEMMDIKHNVLKIRKSDNEICMVKLPFNNYYSTLRNKLMWGADKRN